MKKPDIMELAANVLHTTLVMAGRVNIKTQRTIEKVVTPNKLHNLAFDLARQEAHRGR